MNALMILVAIRLAGGKSRPPRIACGAVFGAGAAWMTRRYGFERAEVLWLPVAAGMMTIAAGRRACRHPARYMLCLLGAGGLLGGVMTALLGAFGSLAAAYPAGCACALWIALRALQVRCVNLRYSDIRIECRGVGMQAMIDSGNTLRDYLTGLPVIVLPVASAKARGMLDGLPTRPIFADTAGGRQMMALAVPKQIAITISGKKRSVLAAAALAPVLDARSPALVPAALIDGEDEG